MRCGGRRAGLPNCGHVHEELPAGGAAAGEHPAGAGEDGADEAARAGQDHPGREGGVVASKSSFRCGAQAGELAHLVKQFGDGSP